MTAERDVRVASPSQCRCGHNERKHTVPGMGGECITCTCLTFRPVERPSAPHRVPVRISAAERRLVASGWVEALVTDIEDHRPKHRQGTRDRSKNRPSDV